MYLTTRIAPENWSIEDWLPEVVRFSANLSHLIGEIINSDAMAEKGSNLDLQSSRSVSE